jgi:predicted PurR-regulated permease PerM
MGRVVEGLAVLLMLSVFFAYLTAPAVAAIRQRVRIGPRQRPISNTAALALLYGNLVLAMVLVWRLSAAGITHWVHETAPAAVDRLFTIARAEPFDRMIAMVPLSAGAQASLKTRLDGAIDYLEREIRSTLQEMIAAAPYALWLAATPMVAFVLLSSAPSFQRSALRVLPRGHLQWRGEEYLRDVNSALAGYVRAQTAAGLLVGLMCVTGFVLLGLPSAVSMGVAAGVLELVPAIGPLTVMVVVATQAGDLVWRALLFLLVLRLVQDYVVYPRLVRRGMRLPTPAVILTIWIGAALAGAAGVILAIPAAGFLSVSVRHWREYRDIERLVRTHPQPPAPDRQA